MKLYFIGIFILIASPMYSQSIDYNKIILPANADSLNFSEKLVQLAWRNYPENRIAEHRVLIAKNEYAYSKWSWLNNIFLAYNANEYTLGFEEIGNNLFFPQYNVGVRFNLGTIAELPKNVKNANENIKISKEQLNLQKVSIRSEVLKRYQTFIINEQIYQIELEALEDAQSKFTLIEQRFINGESTIEDYIQSTDYYNRAKTKKLTAEVNYLNSKIDLEEIIGVRLEDIR